MLVYGSVFLMIEKGPFAVTSFLIIYSGQVIREILESVPFQTIHGIFAFKCVIN